MTFIELKDKYSKFSKSLLVDDRIKSSALLEVISTFEKTMFDEIYDDVKISLISENLYNKYVDLYKIIPNKEYKIKAQTVKMCIINYATESEITSVFSHMNLKGQPLSKYIELLEGTTVERKVKKSDLMSIYKVGNL